MQKTLFLAAALAALANLFWAANAIVGKVVVATLPAFTLSQFRWLLALAILLPFGLPRIIRQWSWYRQNAVRVLILALLSVSLYNTFQYWALEYTQPVNVGAMLALMPIAISIASGFSGGRRQSGLEWFFTGVAVIGALTVVTDGNPLAVFAQQSAGWGELLMVLAIASWATYSVLLKKTPHESVDFIGLLTVFVFIGCIFIVPFWLNDVLVREVYFPNASHVWPLLFVATFPSIVSYFCWSTAIRLSDATIAGLMVTTAPLFNALLSIVFLDQSVSTAKWVGIGVVSGGVAATLLISRRKMLAQAGA